jgi:hypothetical protein
MKSFHPGRVLLLAGLLAASAVFVSGCTVDDSGLAEVEDGGPDGSEPDGSALNADAGDATIGEGADGEAGPSADGGDGAHATPGADGEAAAPGADAGDATVPNDGEADAAPDTGTDTGVTDASGGPDADVVSDGAEPLDAVGDVVTAEDAADGGEEDTGVDASSDGGSEAGPSMTTTSLITNELSSQCADDAFSDNCLSTQCEDLSGADPSLCLATLSCAISGSTGTPYCGLLQDEPDECYCGDDVDFTDCQNGQADGVCLQAEQNGFGSSDPGTITGSYFDTTTASGVANSITSCIMSIPSCLNAAGF